MKPITTIVIGSLLAVCLAHAVSASDGAKIVIPHPNPAPFTQKDYDREYSKTALRRFGASFDAVVEASKYLAQHKFQQALDSCTTALKGDPQMWAAYELRADAYLQMKEPQKALIEINQAISLKPSEWTLYRRRVQVLLDLGNYNDALENADALVNYYGCSKHYSLRARVEEKLGDKSKAIDDWKRAIVASQQEGEDTTYELEQLEKLVGQKVQIPKPDRTGSAEVLRIIAALEGNPLRFHPSFVQEQTKMTLDEHRLWYRPKEHTDYFVSETTGPIFRSITVGHIGTVIYPRSVELVIDTYHRFIGLDQVVQLFGRPVNTDAQSSYASYSRPWGIAEFNFHTHGFKSLYRVVFHKSQPES